MASSLTVIYGVLIVGILFLQQYLELNHFSYFFSHSTLSDEMGKLFRSICRWLTRTWLEDKFTNFGRVDHLWPHKAGDCVYLIKGLSKYFFNYWYDSFLTIFDKFSFRFCQGHHCWHKSPTICDKLTLRLGRVNT